MKNALFQGRVLTPLQEDYVGIDDIVCVNGLVGWLDHCAISYIILLSENEKYYKIPIKKIRSFRKLSTFIKDNLTNIPIKEITGK